MPVAYNMGKWFVPVRKAGKLPAETISKEYELEYGKATIEIHKDAIKPGQKVVIVDDLMATGGTAKAIMEMVEEMGAEVVASAFLIELDFLNGRKALPIAEARGCYSLRMRKKGRVALPLFLFIKE